MRSTKAVFARATLLSGSNQALDRQWALEAGFDQFVLKLATRERIIAVLNAACAASGAMSG